MNSELIQEENKEFQQNSINKVPNLVAIQDETGIQNIQRTLQFV